ncbi:hypothetical protein WAB17_00345 [Parerythrobacter aurantius]|uniref:hypothetical protein n=1 Tax=Parerythrobacter aurantius TaxID=3127706 RepID=UPI003247AEBA
MKATIALVAGALFMAVPAAANEADPAAMLNKAAELVAKGDYAAARILYRQVAATPADFKLETTSGTWAYPAEIARRGLLAIERRDDTVRFASSK